MPPPVIHQTDLFRPHEDPDDHWDLATSFALAHSGRIDLRGVLIDHPPPGHSGSPDSIAIAQLNRITGLSVPFAVGSPQPFDLRAQHAETPASGAQDLLEWLDASAAAASIVVCGSCRDVARAAAIAPELFRRKCRAVYLNAGSGTRDPSRIKEPEYNVRLNAGAFAAMFALPCPVYWMPCFETTPPLWTVEEYGTWFSFRQHTVFDVLSRRARNYFLSMLEKRTGDDWQTHLDGETDATSLAHFGAQTRNMWCTAGFLHAARRVASREGRLLDVRKPPKDPVHAFQPIEIDGIDRGTVQWRPVQSGTGRWIFRVVDPDAYPSAMTNALKLLLARLP